MEKSAEDILKESQKTLEPVWGKEQENSHPALEPLDNFPAQDSFSGENLDTITEMAEYHKKYYFELSIKAKDPMIKKVYDDKWQQGNEVWMKAQLQIRKILDTKLT